MVMSLRLLVCLIALSSLNVWAQDVERSSRDSAIFCNLSGIYVGGIFAVTEQFRSGKLFADGRKIIVNKFVLREATEQRFSNLQVVVVNCDATVFTHGGLDIDSDSIQSDSFAFVVGVPDISRGNKVDADIVKNEIGTVLGGIMNPIGYSIVTLEARISRQKTNVFYVGVRSLKPTTMEGEPASSIAQRLSLDIARILALDMQAVVK